MYGFLRPLKTDFCHIFKGEIKSIDAYKRFIAFQFVNIFRYLLFVVVLGFIA